MQHNSIALGADARLVELCDPQDVTILLRRRYANAAIAGEGSLTLNEEIVPLALGRLVLIPARMPHTVCTSLQPHFPNNSV
jgi:hypothetical protein